MEEHEELSVESLARDLEYSRRIERIAEILAARLTSVVDAVATHQASTDAPAHEHSNADPNAHPNAPDVNLLMSSEELADLRSVIEQAQSIRVGARSLQPRRQQFYELYDVIVAIRHEVRRIRLRYQQLFASNVAVRPEPDRNALENASLNESTITSASMLKEPSTKLFLKATEVSEAVESYTECVAKSLHRVAACKRDSLEETDEEDLDHEQRDSQMDFYVDVSDEEDYEQVATQVEHCPSCEYRVVCECECVRTRRPSIHGLHPQLDYLQPRLEECSICMERATLFPAGYDCTHRFCMKCILKLHFSYHRCWHLDDGTFVDADVAARAGRCPLCRATLGPAKVNFYSTLVFFGRMIQLRQVLLDFHTRLSRAHPKTMENCLCQLNMNPSTPYLLNHPTRLHEIVSRLQLRLDGLVLLRNQYLHSSNDDSATQLFSMPANAGGELSDASLKRPVQNSSPKRRHFCILTRVAHSFSALRRLPNRLRSESSNASARL